MMSTSQINELSRKAAYRAARAKRQPFIFEAGDPRDEVLANLPFIGSYTPKGWKRVDIAKEIGDEHEQRGDAFNNNIYFVDATGDGSNYEIAITQKTFAKALRPGYGYAILEVSPCQVCVGVFKRKERTHKGLTPEQIAMIQRSTY